MQRNYKLSDGTYFHFHISEDGYDYTIYNERGEEIDGGVLEYRGNENLSIDEVLERISIFADLPLLANEDERTEIDEEIIQELEEKEYQRLQENMKKSDKEKEEQNKDEMNYDLC